MAKYTDNFFQEYIPRNDSEENVTKDNLLFPNISKSKYLVDFIYATLRKNHRSLTLYSNYNRIQKNVIDVTGPLSIFWSGLENLKSIVKD